MMSEQDGRMRTRNVFTSFGQEEERFDCKQIHTNAHKYINCEWRERRKDGTMIHLHREVCDRKYMAVQKTISMD